MKIAVIAAADVPSTRANSVQVMKTCQALRQLGHTVRLYLPEMPGRAVTDDVDAIRRHYGLAVVPEIVRLKAASRWKRYDFAWRAIQAAVWWGADLVETRLLQAAVLAQVHARKVLLELHGPPEGLFGPWLFRLFLVLPARKRLLLITQGLKQILEKTYGSLAASRPVVHPNGVDLERFEGLASGAAQAHGSDVDPVQAVYTGHLYEGRGMDLLAGLAKRFPAVQFVWIGGRAADVVAWQKRLAADGVNNVTLTGFLPNADLPRHQAAADILLMPYERVIRGSSGGNSAAYCSPMKMFEYMASGRAILSSDLPVLQEILNVSNSILCPPEDLDVWSQAFERLVNDPALRTRLGEQALRDVQAFTWRARLGAALAGFEEGNP